jgi:hypothetical protein
MSNVKFGEIEQDIQSTRKEIEKIRSGQDIIDERLGQILGSDPLQSVEIDVNDSDFGAVLVNEEHMQANIASLVYGLDEITRTFGDEFKTMSQSTFGESLISIFSKKKSEEMKTSRIRNADIRSNLNSLIEKSDVIKSLLQEQLAVLGDRLETSKGAQMSVLDRAQTTAREIEEQTELLDVLAPKIAEIDGRISELTGENLKAIEGERTGYVNEYNEATAKKQELVAVQQSLERYAAMYANYVESLAKQKAAQQTLISKLEIDTEQRTIMYDALVESLRTASQQNVGHRIDDVGRETDAQAEEMITQIGISSENRIVSMMEAHETYMKRTAEVRKKGEIANQEFARRFSEIVKKVDSGRYVE